MVFLNEKKIKELFKIKRYLTVKLINSIQGIVYKNRINDFWLKYCRGNNA